MGKNIIRIGEDFVITNNARAHPFDEYKFINEKWILSLILRFKIKKEERENSITDNVEIFVWRRYIIKEEKDKHEILFKILNRYYSDPELLFFASPLEDNPNKYFYLRHYEDQYNLSSIIHECYGLDKTFNGTKYTTSKILFAYECAWCVRKEFIFKNYQELKNGFVIPKFNLLAENIQKFINKFCSYEHFLSLYEFIEFSLIQLIFFTDKIYPKKFEKNILINLFLGENNLTQCEENKRNMQIDDNIVEIEFLKDTNHNIYINGYLYL